MVLFPREMFFKRLRMTLDMIKFEHSVFALPFALTGALLAFRESGYTVTGAWWLAWDIVLWIVVAMVGARSAAMAFNRLVDAEIDARNPRTKGRHIPAGLLSRTFGWGFTAAASAVFFYASWRLNTLCFRLAPVALAVILGYSFTKRFTHFSHLVLGFALGMAPAAAWIAVRGTLDPRILLLTAAVMFWTAGFDIIYSCQDYEFDRDLQLYSVPRWLGIPKALLVARALHVLMIVCLLLLVYELQLGALSLAGVAAVACLLIYEHGIVKADDLSRVNAAFFTMNGWVSVLFFVFWAADVLLIHQHI
jgi:4-hydroxybenzoate polyprenyltransferase